MITEERKKAPNILIVDDLPDNLHLLGTALKNIGCEISIATEGKVALSLANSSKPDVILLDVLMPGMDGFEVCRQLKNNEKTKDIPVIFLTAKAGSDDVLLGFETGAYDYIVKPFNILEVIARVKMQIELKNQRDMNVRFINQLSEANDNLND